jgi:hypothetical protein
VLVAALLVLIALAGRFGADASAASGSVAFSEAQQGSRGFNLPNEREAAGARVLRSASQAARQLRAWGIEPAATANVDWARESAVVLLAAYQPTGGYRARITRITALGRQLVVTASVRFEGGEVVASSIERPWVVVVVKRSALAGVRGSDARLRLR